MTTDRASVSVRVEAAVEPVTSRGLWLVKWLLLIPHFVVLALLWLVFALFWLVALVAIVVTGRYPRPLFDFNLGVLRWSWRVHYYGYAALGTDRYPPFTLAEVPDYPARLDVPYPERLSRGLVLVKWWLLALPHYLVLALFIGGGAWLSIRARTGNPMWDTMWGAGGLVALLVLIAAIVLLLTGRYPRGLYDFVLGMDRWALRVAAYAALMTDEYPPFRIDMGGPDPEPAYRPGQPDPVAPVGPVGPVGPGRPAGAGRPAGWTAGRIVAVVTGAVLLFVGAGAATTGGGLLLIDQAHRDQGYVSAPAVTVSTDRHAVVTDSFELRGAALDWVVDRITGSARIQVTPTGGGSDLFVGLGRTDQVQDYLRDVGYTQLAGFGMHWDNGPIGRWTSFDHAGGAPATPPAGALPWAGSSSGPGVQTLTWRPAAGNWTLVIMHADASPAVTAQVRVAATLPGLLWLAAGVLGFGILLLAGGGVVVGFAVRRASQAAPPAAGSGRLPVAAGRH